MRPQLPCRLRAVLSLCNKQLFEKYPDPPPEKFVNDMHTALQPERVTPPASPVECVPIPHE